MIDKLIRILSTDRIALALARGGATSAARMIDPSRPATWEFCGFSQNGEDGIIDYLLRAIRDPNRYFVEIGSASGLENNTSWLAVARRYAGLMVEGSHAMVRRLNSIQLLLGHNVGIVEMFVDQRNAKELVDLAVYRDPDFLSVDIDGNDYYVTKALLDAGLRPKVLILEYNSAFGPERSLTIAYRPKFVSTAISRTGLYYGVSISAWRKWLSSIGYRFVTVEQNGVNAFFIDPAAFDRDFLLGVQGLDFRENSVQLARFRRPWSGQFELLNALDFVEI